MNYGDSPLAVTSQTIHDNLFYVGILRNCIGGYVVQETYPHLHSRAKRGRQVRQ